LVDPEIDRDTMHRTLVITSFAILALVSSRNTALAQVPATRDAVTQAPIDVGPVVDTASQKLRRNPRDLALGSCALRSQSSIGYVLPLFCAERLNGQIDRALFDSVTFIGGDHQVRLAISDMRALNRFNRDKRDRVITGALIGGGLGFLSTVVLGLRYGSDLDEHGLQTADNGFSLRNAFVVGGMGALVGAFSGSRFGGGWPRVLEDAQR
jgi:hypothetical protein